MYICSRVFACVHVCVCVCASTLTCVCLCGCARPCVCMSVSVRMCMYMYVRACSPCMCVCLRASWYVRVYVWECAPLIYFAFGSLTMWQTRFMNQYLRHIVQLRGWVHFCWYFIAMHKGTKLAAAWVDIEIKVRMRHKLVH